MIIIIDNYLEVLRLWNIFALMRWRRFQNSIMSLWEDQGQKCVTRQITGHFKILSKMFISRVATIKIKMNSQSLRSLVAWWTRCVVAWLVKMSDKSRNQRIEERQIFFISHWKYILQFGTWLFPYISSWEYLFPSTSTKVGMVREKIKKYLYTQQYSRIVLHI